MNSKDPKPVRIGNKPLHENRSIRKPNTSKAKPTPSPSKTTKK
ncbi:hypothetical protein ACA592_12935 [Lactiplantibacillus plantarum]